MALLALGGFVAFSLYREHSRIDIQERQRLMAQARLVDENLGRQLNASNLALSSIRSELPYWVGKVDSLERANRRLKGMSDAMPGVRTLVIMDARGTIIASDRQELIGKNFSHREYFQAALQNPNADTLFVSPPFKTALGVFTMNVTRMIPGPAGQFAGIVSATLDPEEFNTLLSSIRYTDDMLVSLIHGDGKVFLTAPKLEQELGRDLKRTSTPFTRHLDSGRKATVLTGLADDRDTERLIALRTIRPEQLNMDKPLVVAVSRDLSALFATWRHDVAIQAGLFALLVLISSPGLLFYQRRQLALDSLTASYRAERQESAERLKLATEGAGLGVWEFDLVNYGSIWDESMFAIYGRDPAALSPNYEEWKNCLLPEDLAATEAEFMAAIDGRRKFKATFRIRRGDGEIRVLRALAQVHCEDDGCALKMVGINEDITERKKAEQDLRIAATAFETQDGMMVTDSTGVILRVNRAFTKLTGYSADEAVGRTPAILRSGRQDEGFYRELWAVLVKEGFWEGEIWNRRKNGETFPEWLTISAVFGPDESVTHYVGIFSDITASKAAEEQIRSLAFYDPLTQLPNRRLLIDRFGQAQLASVRRKNYGAVLFLDLDRFKQINDTSGHEVGDLLLVEVAQRLLSCVRAEDTVARLGGDEFVVLLEELSREEPTAAAQAKEVAEKIRVALDAPYTLRDRIHVSTPSIGVCLFIGTENTVSDLLTRADQAMYRAKAAGRNTVCFYAPEASLDADSMISQGNGSSKTPA